MRKLFLLLITMGFLVGGCSVLSPVKEHSMHYYTLSTSVPSEKTAITKNKKKLAVTAITSEGFYNTPKMVYADQELQLNYFAYQQWTAPPAQLLTTQLINFLLGHQFIAVNSNASLSNRFVLKTELLDFKQDYTHTPAQAVMGVRVQLDDMVNNRLVFIKTIYVLQPFYLHDAHHGVRALDQAKLNVFKRIASLLHRYLPNGDST